MRNLLLTALFAFGLQFGQAQSTQTNYLSEVSGKACECMEKIEVFDRSKKEVIQDIKACIDEQVTAYQLISKLSSVFDENLLDLEQDQGKKKKKKKSKDKKEVNITININENSNDYKAAYYEIERHLMANCEELQLLINSNEKQSEFSISKDPESIRYYELGYAEAKEGNCTRAIEYYQEALRIDPKFAFAWDNIGICYRRLEQYDKAIEAYNQSLELDPYGKMPLQNIAIVYTYTKEYDKAIQAYERLGEVHPGNPEVAYGIGHTYTFGLEKYEEGLHQMCQAYLSYIEEKSPYRTDAEAVINHIYSKMKAEGKENLFLEILKLYNINYR